MKPHQGEKQTQKDSNIRLGKGELLVKKNEHYVMAEFLFISEYNMFLLSRSVVGFPTRFNLC